MEKAIIYDVVMCVGQSHVNISIKAISSLLFFSDARKIFVITPQSVLNILKNRLPKTGRIRLIDESNIIDDTSIKTLKKQFVKRAVSYSRFGWYLQQFLKMNACEIPELSDHYLIWDGDTVLLKKIKFFDNNRKTFICPAIEYHKPYFDLIHKVLGLDKQVHYSFISEHLMIKKEYMKSLINNLATNAPPNISWMEFILHSIDDKDLPHSGFSEYETYGNFLAFKFNDSFSCRKINSTRNGSKLYGNNPNQYALFSLMRSGYTYATFESWQNCSKPKRLTRACISRFLWILHRLTKRCRGQRKAATELVR